MDGRQRLEHSPIQPSSLQVIFSSAVKKSNSDLLQLTRYNFHPSQLYYSLFYELFGCFLNSDLLFLLSH